MLEERVARIESDVEHLKVDVAEIKTDQRAMRQELNGLRDEFNSFRVEVTREFGRVHTSMESLRTAIEQNKRWMIVAAAGLVSTGVGTLTAMGRMMKWF